MNGIHSKNGVVPWGINFFLLEIIMEKYFLLVFCCVFLFSCNIGNKEMQDDRLVEVPFNDSILGNLVDACQKYSDRNRNPYFDSIVYYVTFNFFTKNDSDKVWVMGCYGEPYVFHDISGDGKDKFIGYFKRQSVFCFFYKHLFEQSNDTSLSTNLQSYIDKSIKDWKFRREKENIDWFPVHWYNANIDPYMFEYSIDSIGNVQLLKKGHW